MSRRAPDGSPPEYPADADFTLSGNYKGWGSQQQGAHYFLEVYDIGEGVFRLSIPGGPPHLRKQLFLALIEAAQQALVDEYPPARDRAPPAETNDRRT